MTHATRPLRCPTCHRPHKRSSDQNRRYWLLLHMIAERVTPLQQTYSADQWHEYFKSRFLGCEEVKLPNGKVLQIPRSSADLTTPEFNDYMTQVEAWASERDIFLEDREAA